MSSNNNTQKPAGESEQPGLISGHVHYFKGAAESAIGGLTGSHAWTGSGEQDKAAAVASMKTAAENRDTSRGYGKVEEVAGKLTGCEGMKAEGAASANKGA